MFSVYILQDFLKFKDKKTEIGTFLKDKTLIFDSVLYALLNYNGIKCKVIKPLGIERDFELKAKQNTSLVYAPIITFSSNPSVSFIYTDCTESFSKSFRLAALLRNERSALYEDRVTFINPLKCTDYLADFSPIVFDIMRIDDEKNPSKCDDPILSAVITAKAFCEFYGIQFRNDNFMHI